MSATLTTTTKEQRHAKILFQVIGPIVRLRLTVDDNRHTSTALAMIAGRNDCGLYVYATRTFTMKLIVRELLLVDKSLLPSSFSSHHRIVSTENRKKKTEFVVGHC